MQKGIKDGYGYAVDIDLSKFFDKVDHDLLMNRLGKWVTSPALKILPEFFIPICPADSPRTPR
jgi:retron-type reverse transcriptase